MNQTMSSKEVRPITLSYSSLTQWMNCPGQYYRQRILKQQVEGEKDSKHHAATGTLIQRVFEDFYNERLWEISWDFALNEMKDRLNLYYKEFLDTEYINWKDPSNKFNQITLKEQVSSLIEPTLNVIKSNDLLGSFTSSEFEIGEDFTPLDLSGNPFPGNFRIYGKLDFLIKKDDGTVLILDGKASVKREQNVSSDQLYFYALLFLYKFGYLPDKLGFLFYHFCKVDPTIAIDWHDVNMVKLHNLKANISKAFIEMTAGTYFIDTPTPKFCRYCQYENICDARIAQKKKNSRGKNKNNISLDSVPSGFIDFGMVDNKIKVNKPTHESTVDPLDALEQYALNLDTKAEDD